MLAGKSDQVVVIGGKTGQPNPVRAVQVVLYVYALPRALERYHGLLLTGQVAYPDHVVDIPAEAVDEAFVRIAGRLITRLAPDMPARQIPSPSECRFCEITSIDCPDRVESGPPEEGMTDDF